MKHLPYLSMLLVSISLLFCSFVATAQVELQWDETLGGDDADTPTSSIPTPDGGYLLVGQSRSSASGDKSENNRGEYDYWIVKIDQNGNKLWDKTLGGNNNDYLNSAIATADGGYLLAGYSYSNASGDKTEDRRGNSDYWVVKVDESGNKLWDRTLGGFGNENLTSITSTEDEGYLLAGYSSSNASADKSEESKGGFDYWIVKIDESGNKLWDRTIGGNNNDFLSEIIPAFDGGYLLAGGSASNASSDKSEESKGNFDYWIVKIDESGNKLWDRTLGGSNSEEFTGAIRTPDENYLLTGWSISSVSGDKTENNRGAYDYWIVKIDQNGNKLWDKTLGGNEVDYLYDVIATADGDYLLAGSSASEVSGDKRARNKGEIDYWIVKIDDHGNKLWDKTLGGNRIDEPSDIIPTAEGEYLIAGYSISDVSGDKSENNRGGADYWIMKIQEEEFFLQNFALVNAETDEQLQEIHHGDVIDLATLQSNKLSIEAITEPEVVGSVAFRLTGPFIHQHTENYVPYAIFGDNPAGDFSGRLLPPGEYTLTATPYEEKNKAGTAGTPFMIHFTIIHSEEIEDSQVTGFDLYDAVTDKKIMDLEDGSVVYLDVLARDELTVLIHTVPDFVGSVKVELWGPMSLTRIENTKPYALFRNNSKDLFGEALPAGAYTLKATPYPEENAQGEAGEPLQISFTVIGGNNSNARLAAYPVPTSGVVHVNYEGTEEIQLMLLDFTGQPLLTLPLNEQIQLDMSSYRKGIYYLKVVDQQGVHLKRVVVE